MKKKGWIIFSVVLFFLISIVFSAMWIWENHKAKVILKTLEIITGNQVQSLSTYLPEADKLEELLVLPEKSTEVPEDGKVYIPESVQTIIDEQKTGKNEKETQKKTKKFKKQVDEWVELFGYLLPNHISPDDIAEEDAEAVVAIVRAKMTTGDVMKMALMVEGGLTNEEKQEIYSIMTEKFTEEELTVLVQIYRKYTE